MFVSTNAYSKGSGALFLFSFFLTRAGICPVVERSLKIALVN
jgi:hypothetical protein